MVKSNYEERQLLLECEKLELALSNAGAHIKNLELRIHRGRKPTPERTLKLKAYEEEFEHNRRRWEEVRRKLSEVGSSISRKTPARDYRMSLEKQWW